MQVSIETTQGLERKMTISVPAAEVEQDIHKKLQHLSRTQKIPGFRPGKIPFSVIKKKYGQAVRQDVYAELMQRHYYQTIIDQKISPAGAPHIEPKETTGDQLEFEAVFEVYPEIEVADLAALKIVKPAAEVIDADVAQMLETLQKQRAEWLPIKRMAKKGDQVITDFEGRVDGEAFEGGKGDEVAVILGEGQMLADFEKGLLKIKTGEKREIEVKFPDDYQAEDLAGKTAIFKVFAKEVKGQKLPKLDEDFVKQFAIDSGDIEELKQEVKKNMERELSQTLKTRIKTVVFDAFAAANKFTLPTSMIDQEIERLRHQMSHQFQSQGQGDLPELPASLFEDQATKRVTLGLLMSEIIKKEQLKADQEKVRSALEEMSSAYDDPEEVINYYYSDKNKLAEIESVVLEDAVVEFILTKATVTDDNSSFDEIMNPKT